LVIWRRTMRRGWVRTSTAERVLFEDIAGRLRRTYNEAMGQTVDRAYPSIAQAIILVLLLLAIQLFLGMMIGVAMGVTGQKPTPEALQLGLLNCVAIGITLAWGCGKAGGPIRALVFPTAAVPWLMLVAMSLSVIGIGVLISEFGNLLLHVMPSDSVFERFLREMMSPDENPLGVLFLLVVVAPITEEPLFRGLILQGFLKQYTMRRSIVVSAVLFALMHLNPLQFPTAFVLGLLFGWWRVRTRSLWPCVWGHMLNNGLPVVIAMLGVEIRGYTAENLPGQVQFQPLWLDVLGAAVALGGVMWTAAQMRRLPPMAVARPLPIATEGLTIQPVSDLPHASLPATDYNVDR
jgi:membrane protease YdiL (CAAX protease family)